MYTPHAKTNLTAEQLNQFERTELEGVLPSVDFLIEHLSQFGDQFDVAIGHLNKAGRSIHKVAVSS